jgi:hypothetical protein
LQSIGTTGGDSLEILSAGESKISATIDELRLVYASALDSQLAGEVFA